MELTYEDLKETVRGGYAAFRINTRLQPAGGPGTKVFPPTYSGGVYAWEKRRIGSGNTEIVDTVILDSVPSQANRMEEALLTAANQDVIELPRLEVDFSSTFPDIGCITTLDAPHRIADAIFRDSLLDGIRFRESGVGQAFSHANIRNATALFQYCPNALIFGVWDSTGAAGGLGNKIQRAVVSEIVGFLAVKKAFTGGFRIDPLNIERAAKVFETESGDWSNDPDASNLKRNKKGEAPPLRPSEFNHSNIVVNAEKDAEGDFMKGGVTLERATQTWVLSLPALRRLRFPLNGGAPDASVDQSARTVLAALALAAYAHLRQAGYDLRSRCLLVPEGEPILERIAANGSIDTYSLDVDSSNSLLSSAVEDARSVGLSWPATPLQLEPEERLVELVRRSREALTLADKD